MQKIFNSVICGLCVFNFLNAQNYNDYIGGGHSQGIAVFASSNMDSESNAKKSLDGSGLDNPFMEASRFLDQAAVSHDLSEVSNVMNMGYEAWIDDQFTKPVSHILPEMEVIWHDLKVLYANNGIDTSDIFGPYSKHYNYALWTVMMTHEDYLRQRVAQALSEILVISMNSDLRDWGESLSSFYDLLLDNTFGNYYDILNDVSKSVPMGYYLSHINNPKTDTTANIRPDENYAREIMQLFSIGLYKLNIDGTPKRDSDGNPIPTYDNADIKEMAKIFTGLGCGALENRNNWPYTPIFGVGLWAIDKTKPMQMFNDHHEPGPKVILKDITIDIPGDGMAEVDSVISYLFHHDNVGPFISYRLIQRLVKSNPSPAYVARVASAFNDNGNGVRGDMQAIIKAILLDEEARSGEYMNEESAGMVKPPFLRYASFLREIPLDNPSGKFWNNGFSFLDKTLHWPLAAPSVFNFYLPNHQPIGDFIELDLVSPELKIHNTSSAINYVNNTHEMINWNAWYDWEDNDIINTDVWVDLIGLMNESDDIEKMINMLDIHITNGQLSEYTRQNMRDAMNALYWTWDEDWRWHRASLLTYLFLISPDYVVLK
jgi:uncharacterized protein (DUF1800 family)